MRSFRCDGIVPVELDAATIASKPGSLTIDLPAQTVCGVGRVLALRDR